MHGPRMLECDLLVIGSGASGLAAAVTAAHYGLKVIVAEKTAQLGGTSAWSGGWLWIPRNALAKAEGQQESAEEPARYLRSQVHQDQLNDVQRTYLERGPEMVDFFQQHTAVRFYSGTRMPDMRDAPGAALGGRSLCAQPYDGRALGDWIYKLRPPLDVISLGGMGIAGGVDLGHFFNATTSLASMKHVTKRLARHIWDVLRYGRGQQLVNGNALVARLLRSALDLGVEFLTSAPAVQLIGTAKQISGAVLEIEGQRVEVLARRGVVLACGGFPHNQARLAQLTAQTTPKQPHYSAAPPENTGDGLRLGEQVGGQVADDLVHAVAWAPVSLVPRSNGQYRNFPHLIDRAKPGFLAVGADGQRFSNEADCYHDVMNQLFASTATGKPYEAWLICDHKARNRYGIGWAKPFPFWARYYQYKGYLFRGKTLAELAKACGIDAASLEATVKRFNQYAAQGEDPDFGRGRSAYNKAQGEVLHGPNPSLRPLQGPFYAVKLLPGSLGTFAGLKTDAQARVLNTEGQAIPGLFAVGNDMNTAFGGYYPSGGITLGPGMTFGYLAGRALAGRH